MTHETKLGFCGWTCWIIGVIAGIFAYLMSQGAVGWGPALLVGLAVAIFVGLVLRATFCKSAEGVGTEKDGSSGDVGGETDTGVTTAAMAAGGASAVAAGAGSAGAAPTGADDAAAKDAAARAASEKAEAEKSAEAKVETGTYKAAEAKPAKKAPAAKPAAKAPASDTPEKKPHTLEGPREGGADDLKLISGVGPKLEQTLNELGFWHFDQIAAWGSEEIAWVDSRLRFKGRIARDDWMSQARTLAEGGETEFSKKKKKG